MPTRKEHDFIGELEIDDSLYYGIQTLRAVENFNISHEKLKDFWHDVVSKANHVIKP